MKLSYDPDANIAYIQLRYKPTHVKTVRVSNELNVDIAEDGTIHGIELLNANAHLANGKRITLENLTTTTRARG